MYDTLDNFVSKEITFIYQDSIDSQAKDCLTHLVEKFYSNHPEWRFENKKITSLLEYAIRKTNASIISQLNVDDRILFLQSQKNTQMVIEVLDKMTQQLVTILQSTSLFPEKQNTNSKPIAISITSIQFGMSIVVFLFLFTLVPTSLI